MESDAWKKRGTEVAGKTLVPAYTFPKVVTDPAAPTRIPSINASEIDDSFIGRYLSVVGIVSDVYTSDELAQLIALSGNRNFQLRGYYTIFEDAETGRCIFVTGDIQQDENSLYMEIDGKRISEWDECR